MKSEKVIAYNNAYNKANYDSVTIMIKPKGTKAVWKEEAERRNMSLSEFIQEAVKAYISSSNNN